MTSKKQNQRSYARVKYNRSARLVLDGRLYENSTIRDLSLTGLFLEGSFASTPGDTCTIEIEESGPTSSLVLKIAATVVRVEQDGIALKFEEMKPDSYMFLQTMILYATQDPLAVAQEFLEDFPPHDS